MTASWRKAEIGSHLNGPNARSRSQVQWGAPFFHPNFNQPCVLESGNSWFVRPIRAFSAPRFNGMKKA